MRTTLTIDDDVLRAAKELARREGRTVGQVLSELARRSMTGAGQGNQSSRHGFAVLPSRGGVVSNELVNELRDEEGV
ncbi:hypothetical protein ACI3ET_00090 [Ornithinimicrobium sp. LYQ121]|uniref:hypothetical protein n=1 Tax=Ornithinimicrobium sp. LYQ121 TaxID=3378801 RepID=UPI0038547DEB